MTSKKEKAAQKSKRPAGTLVLYVASIVVAIIGAAYLVTNILMFQKNVVQYIEQGYAAADVTTQLLMSQLLPGIYEPIAVYGGIALILFGAGLINHKISKGLTILGNLGVEGTVLFANEVEIDTPVVDKVDAMAEVAEIKTDEHDSGKSEA